jgi:metallophosphoesterase superfamily enzyme
MNCSVAEGIGVTKKQAYLTVGISNVITMPAFSKNMNNSSVSQGKQQLRP